LDPAQEFILTRQTVTATKVWREDHVVAPHDGHTYDVALVLPMGQTAQPVEFTQVLQTFAWV
jgi:hypothetical protein